jgi:hypothetical protein
MSNLGKAYLFKPIRLSLNLKANYILFPIDYADLMDSLVKRGYKPQQAQPSPTPFGIIRIEPVGPIARKDNNAIIFDPDRQVVGVSGGSVKEVIQTFNDLEQIISEGLQIDISSFVRFYETLAEYQLFTDRNPRQVLESIPGLNDLSSKISSVIGVDVSTFGFRMGSKGMDPNQEEWMDIRVEPVVTKADKAYYLSVVYRSRDKEKVKGFLSSLEDILTQLVGLLEKGP